MKCKKIKEIIASDYLDGELGETLAKQVQEHLGKCNQCRAYAESLYKASVEPFKNLKEIRPPDSVWDKISQDIDEIESGRRVAIGAYLRDYFKSFFSLRRPVFAMAVVIIIIIATGVIMSLGREVGINNYFQEQQDFLSSLDSNSGNSPTGAYTGLGTTIEEYFL